MKTVVHVLAGVVWYVGAAVIVLNAIAQAVRDDQWGLAVLEVVALPLTYFIYPFAAGDHSLAWPLAEGSSLVPVFLLSLVAFPIHNFTDRYGVY